MLALLQHPQQYELLRSNPQLIGSAVEEMLRYNQPVQSIIRCAKEDIAIGKHTIRAGQYIRILTWAIHHNPNYFSDPQRFDIQRGASKHLAFGAGIHYCLGQALARLVAGIAIPPLLARFECLTVLDKEPAWFGGVIFRGLTNLRVR